MSSRHRGRVLAQHNLAWMPTLSGDTQAVLATDRSATRVGVPSSRRARKGRARAVDVEYEPLPAVTSPQEAKADGAPMIRDEKEGQEGATSTTGRRATSDRPRLRRG